MLAGLSACLHCLCGIWPASVAWAVGCIPYLVINEEGAFIACFSNSTYGCHTTQWNFNVGVDNGYSSGDSCTQHFPTAVCSWLTAGCTNPWGQHWCFNLGLVLAVKIAVHTWLVMLTVSLPASFLFAYLVHTGVFLWLRFGGLGLLTLQGALLTMCSRPSTVTVMHTAVRFTMVASTFERAGQNVSLLVATGLSMIGHLYWITGKKHGLELGVAFAATFALPCTVLIVMSGFHCSLFYA